jgi:hypothetical protein
LDELQVTTNASGRRKAKTSDYRASGVWMKQNISNALKGTLKMAKYLCHLHDTAAHRSSHSAWGDAGQEESVQGH